MTLVVGNVTPRGVWLSSDMRITDPSAANAPGFLGAALKLILVSPTLCIGYAGTVGGALAAVRQVDAEKMAPAAAVEYLLSAHREHSTFDFLVASIRPSVLVEIKDGRAARRQTAWLGDVKAFSRYQALYHGEHFLPPFPHLDPEYKADLDIAVKMNDAMQDLVLANSEAEGPDDSNDLVGEASVTVGPRAEDGLFKYHLYFNHRGSFASGPASSGPLMSTAHGSFTISFLAAEEPGIGAIGIYFPEGRLGLLYAPVIANGADRPERFHSSTAAAFAESVNTRYGVSLRGVGGLGPSLP